jgi:carboxypeptidase C (cathepsin A)
MTDADKLALREALKESWWVNALDHCGTWSGTSAGFIAPATEKMIRVMECSDKAVTRAPLTYCDLDDLLDWAVDRGYFDDKFPRWQTERTLFDEETEEWAEYVADAEEWLAKLAG